MKSLTAIDHLVVAGPDLTQLERWWRDVAGIPASPGGAHEGRGTRNSLVGIDDSTYLELIGPDRDQKGHTGDRPFAIDSLQAIRLVASAIAVGDLDRAVAAYAEAGVEVGGIQLMSRRRPDGSLLKWRLAIPSDPHDTVIPFLIEWGADSRHPATDLDRRVDLISLDLTHPEPERIRAALMAVSGVDMDVGPGEPGLAAVFGTLRGPVAVASKGIDD